MRTVLLFALVLTAGCSHERTSDAAELPLTVVRDSAGITIVENPIGKPGELGRWHLDPDPAFSLGAMEGDPTLEFVRIDEAIMLSDGEIVVVDGRANNVRVFDGKGRFQRWLGRRGSGPGEFESVGLLGSVPGDTLYFVDHRLLRVSKFTPVGEFLGSFSLQGGEPVSPMEVGVFRDGTVIGRSRSRGSPSDEYDNVLQRLPVSYWGIDTQGIATVEFGIHPGQEQSVGREILDGGTIFTYQRLIPFGKEPVLAASWDHLFLGTADRFEILKYDREGTLSRIIRLARPLRPVTGTLKAELIEAAIADVDPDEAPRIRTYYSKAHYPVYLPAYRGFQVDPLGYLWVEEYRPDWEGPASWVVFDSQGHLAAQINLPDDLTLMDVGEDYVLAVRRDYLDVEYVQLFRLNRAQESSIASPLRP